MYLIGATVQAAIVGGIIAFGILHEHAIRSVLNVPSASAQLEADVERIRDEVDAIARRLDAVTDAVRGTEAQRTAMNAELAGLRESIAVAADAFPSPGDADDLATRIRVLEQLIARVESKIDDVRDASLFPTPTGRQDDEPSGVD